MLWILHLRIVRLVRVRHDHNRMGRVEVLATVEEVWVVLVLVRAVVASREEEVVLVVLVMVEVAEWDVREVLVVALITVLLPQLRVQGIISSRVITLLSHINSSSNISPPNPNQRQYQVSTRI